MSDTPELITCQVTGEPVPADETVVLHGKQVGARGKQILLERLETGQKIDDHPEAPSFSQRFGGSILDGIIVGLLGAAVSLTGGLVVASNPNNIGALRIVAAASLIGVAIAVAYYTWQHAHSGKTVGKRAAKTLAYNTDGTPISTPTAFVRALVFTGVQGISPLILLIGGVAAAPASGVANGIVGLFVLANCITVLVSRDKRALHDMIAGTRVVRTDT